MMSGLIRVRALKWLHSTRLKPVAGQTTRRPFCSNDKPTESDEAELSHYRDSYRQLQNLDLVSAAKIAFTDPPKKKKKFGLDFHLVQLFFALLPSFAVYLVAQYARSEMRKMDADLDERKKKEDGEKARELELKEAADREKALSAPEFLEVKARIENLEKAVKEIASESKKRSGNEANTALESGRKSNGKDSRVGQSSTQEKGPRRAGESSPS